MKLKIKTFKTNYEILQKTNYEIKLRENLQDFLFQMLNMQIVRIKRDEKSIFKPFSTKDVLLDEDIDPDTNLYDDKNFKG